jgi:hypothetical protein
MSLNFSLFLAPLLVTFGVLNSIAWNNNSTTALPFPTILVIVSLLLFVAFPLHAVGSLAGMHLSGRMKIPTRINDLLRPVPRVQWYSHPIFLVIFGGILPFSSVYIELFYIFSALWIPGSTYLFFEVLFLSLLILTLSSAFVTIALTYSLLTMENYHWWWYSILSGGSTGIYIFIYSFIFFFSKTHMDGAFQTSFFFGYMAIISLAFFFLCGSVGFISSLVFVKYVYSSIKHFD